MLVKLGDLCEIKSSKRIFENEYVSSGIPFIRGQEVSDGTIFDSNSYNCYISDNRYNELKHNYGVPKKGDILITAVGTIGNLCYIDSDFKFYYKDGNLLQFTNFRKDIDSKYLFYFMHSDYFKKQLNNNLIGAVQKALTMVMLSNINVPLIDLDSQQKIVGILSSIDSQISRNTAMLKRLQVLSHAIFNLFFADETKLVSLVDFPYIEILKPGILPFEGTKHYIATAEVEGEKLNFSAPLIEFATRENRANMQPIPNSVWFAKMKRSLKHIYVTSQDDHLIDNYIFSTGFCGIKCDDIAFEYMINYLNLPYFEKEKDIISHGATMEGVNNEDLKSFKIHLPSRESLIQFHSKTKDIHCRIANINEMTHHLTLLKNKLLPLLINGQLQ